MKRPLFPAARPTDSPRAADFFAALAAMLLYLISFVGCIHGQAYKAHSLINEHLYREARYEEACVPVSLQPFCTHATKVQLDAWKRHLEELSKAITLGGSAHLQLDLAAADAKAIGKVIP